MHNTGSILDLILESVREEVAQAKSVRPITELKKMIMDAPPVRSLHSALEGKFGLIAEIKRKAPSAGQMLPENVVKALPLYIQSPVVLGISILTNWNHFGMSIVDLQKARQLSPKPVLRKDFIIDEYQIYEARAFGADAILLMANLLEPAKQRAFLDLAVELGMDVLFECHTADQIRNLPAGVKIVGINTRNFDAPPRVYEEARTEGQLSEVDPTTEFERLELGRLIPDGIVKVAESGVRWSNVSAIRNLGIYNALLVGTALLKDPAGIESALERFEREVTRASM